MVEVESLAARVLLEATQHGQPRVLLDISGLEGDIPTLHRFKLGELAAQHWQAPLCVAIV